MSNATAVASLAAPLIDSMQGIDCCWRRPRNTRLKRSKSTSRRMPWPNTNRCLSLISNNGDVTCLDWAATKDPLQRSPCMPLRMRSVPHQRTMQPPMRLWPRLKRSACVHAINDQRETNGLPALEHHRGRCTSRGIEGGIISFISPYATEAWTRRAIHGCERRLREFHPEDGPGA